jgi:hypothetical protein
LVRLGVFRRCGAGGERRIYVLYAVCLAGFSSVYRAWSVFKQTGDALVALAGSRFIRHISFDFGLAICQF